MTLVHASPRLAEFQVWFEDDAKMFLSELEGIDLALGARLADYLFVRKMSPRP
jgi:hypothetical protein